MSGDTYILRRPNLGLQLLVSLMILTVRSNLFLQILCSVDPRQIPRLSPCDDDIYAKFRESFPDLKVGALKEADLKSESAKKEWREFCEGFKHVEDYREEFDKKIGCRLCALLRLGSMGYHISVPQIAFSVKLKLPFACIEPGVDLYSLPLQFCDAPSAGRGEGLLRGEQHHLHQDTVLGRGVGTQQVCHHHHRSGQQF